MTRASAMASARAMALGTLTPQKNTSQLADFCSAHVAGFYAAIDTMPLFHDAMSPRPAFGRQSALASLALFWHSCEGSRAVS